MRATSRRRLKSPSTITTACHLLTVGCTQRQRRREIGNEAFWASSISATLFPCQQIQVRSVAGTEHLDARVQRQRRIVVRPSGRYGGWRSQEYPRLHSAQCRLRKFQWCTQYQHSRQLICFDSKSAADVGYMIHISKLIFCDARRDIEFFCFAAYTNWLPIKFLPTVFRQLFNIKTAKYSI